MLDAMKSKIGGGAPKGGSNPLGGLMSGGMAPTESTPASDDSTMQDFLNNPNPTLEDVVSVVKALVRDDQADDQGGEGTGTSPLLPPPGGAGGATGGLPGAY